MEWPSLETHPHRFTMHIDYPTSEAASMVLASLAADKELSPSRVTRHMETSGARLSLAIATTELRILRTVISSFVDMAKLATRTLEAFDTAA